MKVLTPGIFLFFLIACDMRQPKGLEPDLQKQEEEKEEQQQQDFENLDRQLQKEEQRREVKSDVGTEDLDFTPSGHH